MVMNAASSRLSAFAEQFARVSIVAVGADGNKILSDIFESGGYGAQCIALSADKDTLAGVYAHERILITPGSAAAEERGESQVLQSCISSVTPLLIGTDVAFIVTKVGQERQTGLTWAVSEIAREAGAVVVGVAILPLPSEKERRLDASNELAGMRNSCHTLTIVDASRLPESLGYASNEFGEYSDRMVTDFVSGLAETLSCPTFMNINVAAFRELMMQGGIAHLGIAQSSSAFRAEEATIGALRGPLLYDDICRTRGALVNVRGDSSLTIEEAEMAAELVSERGRWSIPVVTGARMDESWDDGLQVTIMMTGGAYPYIPGGYRRLPLAMYEMEPDAEEEPVGIDLELDQLEES